MTPNTEQLLLQMTEQIGKDVGELKKEFASFKSSVLGEDGDGRLPVVEQRLNDHANRLRILEEARAALPCVDRGAQIAAIAKKLSWLERLAWLLMGGMTVIVWELGKIWK